MTFMFVSNRFLNLKDYLIFLELSILCSSSLLLECNTM